MQVVFEIECPRETCRQCSDRKPSGLDSGVWQPDEGLLTCWRGHLPCLPTLQPLLHRLASSNSTTPDQKRAVLKLIATTENATHQHHFNLLNAVSQIVDIIPIDTSRQSGGIRLLGTQELGCNPIITSPKWKSWFYAISKPIIISCISNYDHGHSKPEQPLFPRSRENPCDNTTIFSTFICQPALPILDRANSGNLLRPPFDSARKWSNVVFLIVCRCSDVPFVMICSPLRQVSKHALRPFRACKETSRERTKHEKRP